MGAVTPSSYLDSRRILVVDDEEMILGVAARLLRKLPVEVDTASSGKEALRKVNLAPFKYDLVMLDLTMPELDGRSTLVELQRVRADLPVVIMSGLSVEHSQEVLGEVTCSGFLPKPFVIDDVRKLVMRMLPS